MLAAALAALAVPAPLVAAQATEKKPPAKSPETLKGLSIEELSRIAVISASRHTEPASDAAASIVVIAGEAIRRAGVRTLADAMRLATGVSVGRDLHSWAISARGFNASTANKMVVMIDGRSIYTPLFSGVFWSAQDLVLEDIERIEIIRGAGGTLWGANAVNGVINIITKLSTVTQGGLLQIGAGSDAADVSARYGGTAGADGHYRIYSKFRRLASMPLADGTETDEPLRAGQGGFRLDLGPKSPTSLTLQGDAYFGQSDLATSDPSVDFSGGNVVGRWRRTHKSGRQLQVQWYYDTTYRKVPGQYTERRHSGEVELETRVSLGKRHHLVAGGGLFVSRDRVTTGGTLFMDPASRTAPLLNIFVQDQITLLPERLTLTLGSKFEHNDYTGFEVQPTARLRWRPAVGHTLWGGLSRAVRIPARFDSDLQFTGGQSFVVLHGNKDFKSERAVTAEVGYRTFVIPKVAVGGSAFVTDYDDLRSQEPQLPTGFPIVLDNKHDARIAGVELGVHVEPAPNWQVWGGYAWLRERFRFDPDSRDPTGGSLEHNDPSHQVWLRSFSDLPGRWAFDATFKWVGALPRPATASYGELTLRVARPLARRLDLEFIGDNLLHDRHVEFPTLGPIHGVPRVWHARLTWRSR